MNLLLDTNVVLSIVRAENLSGILDFINPDKVPIYLSIVSEAEIKSFSLRKKWGVKRLEFLDSFLKTAEVIEVNELFVNTYVQIDSYSQRLNPSFETYPFDTLVIWVRMIYGSLHLQLC